MPDWTGGAVKVAVTVALTGGALFAPAVHAHAQTPNPRALAAPTSAHAATNDCNGSVELVVSGGGHLCINTSRAVSVNINVCNISSVDNGNHWVAFTWGLGLPATRYVPGSAPGSKWFGGLPVCIGRVDIDT